MQIGLLIDTLHYLNDHRQDLLLEYRGLRFKTTWGLFSPRTIDDGSRLLLDHLELEPADDCLDLGCGYGVLGLCMARSAPQGHTLMVDKDFVAVDGFKQIPARQFDVIVSNIPAKVGKEMLYIYLFDALDYLKPGGAFYIVTITGLRQFFKRGFSEVFGNYEKIKQGKSYTVARGIKQ